MAEQGKLGDDGTMTVAQRLRNATTARVAIGRVGSAIPTAASLDFQLAHARARDAVLAALAPGAFGRTLHGRPVIELESRAPSRQDYLLRPDLGRRLSARSRARLTAERAEFAIVLADGLSATATRAHGAALAGEVLARAGDWRAGPIVVAHQARVALGDEVGEALGADLVIVLIGERPGLSAADSLSAYLTWQPRVGRLDSERACISNIRPPHGMGIAAAADEIMRIAQEARRCGCTGVAMLKAGARGDGLLPGA